MENARQTAEEMLDFIEKSPTCFHAAENISRMLEAEGYLRLKEEEDWTEALEAWKSGEKTASENGDGRFFVMRNDSSVIAFCLPEASRRKPADFLKGFHIAASHGDSPSFKVKELPEMTVENHYVKLNTEKYGGMILSSWMDRPLSVAGRLAVKTDRGIETKLVNLAEDLLVIPNLAIHMNREMNKGFEYNPQLDMLPLFGEAGEEKDIFLKKIAAAAGVPCEDILGHDLFLYVRQPGRIIGAGEEFVLSPRLDDLQCAYSAVRAFLERRPSEYLNVCAVFDNEEVGSGTRQGADSAFLEGTLLRICEALGMTMGEYHRMVAGGFLISADNAHAVHPNHPEKADPTNRPYLNGGIVIKYHGSQRYTTDAVSAARMKALCSRANVPCQTYANRSDIVGGSTLGNISVSHVSIASVDIGLPQLAMHSAVETAGAKDTEYAVRVLKEFFAE